MIPVTRFLDTGAGPNLMGSWFIPPSWRIRIKHVAELRLSAATSQPLNVTGVILLNLHMGGIRVRTLFGVLRKVAVPVLLDTSFIEWFVKRIFPPERKAFPFHSKTIAIIKFFEYT